MAKRRRRPRPVPYQFPGLRQQLGRGREDEDEVRRGFLETMAQLQLQDALKVREMQAQYGQLQEQRGYEEHVAGQKRQQQLEDWEREQEAKAKTAKEGEQRAYKLAMMQHELAMGRLRLENKTKAFQEAERRQWELDKMAKEAELKGQEPLSAAQRIAAGKAYMSTQEAMTPEPTDYLAAKREAELMHPRAFGMTPSTKAMSALEEDIPELIKKHTPVGPTPEQIQQLGQLADMYASMAGIQSIQDRARERELQKQTRAAQAMLGPAQPRRGQARPTRVPSPSNAPVPAKEEARPTGGQTTEIIGALSDARWTPARAARLLAQPEGLRMMAIQLGVTVEALKKAIEAWGS